MRKRITLLAVLLLLLSACQSQTEEATETTLPKPKRLLLQNPVKPEMPRHPTNSVSTNTSCK